MFGLSAYSQAPYSSLAASGNVVLATAAVDAFATVTANAFAIYDGAGSINGSATVSAVGIRIQTAQ
jgi:hypothetical protein